MKSRAAAWRLWPGVRKEHLIFYSQAISILLHTQTSVKTYLMFSVHGSTLQRLLKSVKEMYFSTSGSRETYLKGANKWKTDPYCVLQVQTLNRSGTYPVKRGYFQLWKTDSRYQQSDHRSSLKNLNWSSAHHLQFNTLRYYLRTGRF